MPPPAPRPSTMSGLDAAWLGLEARDNRLTVTAVLRLAGPVDEGLLRDLVRARMPGRYPKFRQRIVGRGLRRPAWADDAAFDLDRHVVVEQLDAPTELAALVARLVGEPLDAAHSPWQLHLVRCRGAGDVLVARIHHCIADGMALAAVLGSLTDPADGAAPHSDQRAAGRAAEGAGRPGPVRLAVSVVTTGLRILCLPPVRRSRLRAPLGVPKVVAWGPAYDLADVKAAARVHGCSVNDLLLAAVAGALRDYLLARGEPAADVRVLVPVDLRPPGAPVPADLGNRIGLALVLLPVGQADRAARVAALRGKVRARRTAEAAATYTLLRVIGTLPAWTHRAAADLLGARCPVIVTNVRGPAGAVTLAGVAVEEAVFWVPQAGPVGLGISIFGYAGGVSVGVAADANVVPDPDALVAAVAAELHALFDMR